MSDLSEERHPLLVIISGPSGVGKDAVIDRMRDLREDFHFTVTATTRPKRLGEIDGKDYIFLSREAFENQSRSGNFLEWAEVYGNFYGVPKSQVTLALKNGLTVIIKIDVQGARTIKSVAHEATFIFLLPPSIKILEERLRKRMTESHEDLQMRLKTAQSELKESKWFDYSIVNEDRDIDCVVNQILDIVGNLRDRNKVIKYFPAN
jgi:guanylate kinase